MTGSEYSLDEFIRAARALPFEKYDCRLCELTFVSRTEMNEHCDEVHDMNRVKNESGDNYYWCETCLRPFDDQNSYDQHASFHRRIKSMVNRGDLELTEMVEPIIF